MTDKKHGGKREGAGRKPKAEEIKLVKLGTDAICEVFGSEQDYWKHIATEARKSVHHLKLLTEYVYGKPKEKIDLTTTTPPTITLNLNEGE